MIHTGAGQWKYSVQCIWKASFPCTATPLLSKLYRDCQNLFCTTLEVKNAGLAELILELESIRSSNHDVRTKAFRSLLPVLDQFLGKVSALPDQKQRLQAVAMFPVSAYKTNVGSTEAGSRTSRQAFWIADLPFLGFKFQGLVPLFDPFQLGTASKPQKLDKVFHCLGIDNRKLSDCVKTEQFYEGDAPTMSDYRTTLLQDKVPYILG
jgi:hypothetical protein